MVVARMLSTCGALTIADVDAGQSNFTAQASTPGSNGFGTFTLAANGAWTYTANNSQAAIQQHRDSQPLTYSLTAVSNDGTAIQDVTVPIHVPNDVPVIGAVSTGDVTEDTNVVADNIFLTLPDALPIFDAGQSNFTAQASTPGSNGFGTFTLAANGAWTYTANNSLPAIQ